MSTERYNYSLSTVHTTDGIVLRMSGKPVGLIAESGRGRYHRWVVMMEVTIREDSDMPTSAFRDWIAAESYALASYGEAMAARRERKG